MAIRMGILLSLVMLFASSLFVEKAAAHILITDESSVHGAILHITPEDNPVAGAEATLYLNTQKKLLNTYSSANAVIIDQAGHSVPVNSEVEGATIVTDYTFPAQGVYQIVYYVQSNGQEYIFKHSQRISRGMTSTDTLRPQYIWAEVLFIASLVGMILLYIIVINRRHDILHSGM